MRVIAIANQKGGVAKTTTAAAIAQGASERGRKALAIDLDPQGSLTYIMGANGLAAGAYELMKGTPAAQVIQPGAPDIIAASLQLAGADAEFSGRVDRNFLLKAAIETLKGYDLVIVDTPPTLGTLLVNALTAATEVLIPTAADIFALQSLPQLADTIEQVRKYCNPALTIRGALLTRYSPRTVLARDLRETLEGKCETMGMPLLRTAIRDGVAVKESQTMQQSLNQYAPRSKPAEDYAALLNELEV